MLAFDRGRCRDFSCDSPFRLSFEVTIHLFFQTARGITFVEDQGQKQTHTRRGAQSIVQLSERRGLYTARLSACCARRVRQNAL